MIVMGIDIPQSAVAAGEAAIAGRFHVEDVRGEIAGVLHDLFHEGGEHQHFNYGGVNRERLHAGVATRILQSAKAAGRAVHKGIGWWEAIPAGPSAPSAN